MAEREARDKSDVLTYRNHDDQQADFHSQRHTYLSRLGRSGASPKVMQKLARHSTVELTLGRYTHAGLFDLSSAVNALPPLPIKDAPQTERAVIRATGTDDFTGASCEVTGPTTGPNSWASGPNLAQTTDSDRQHLRAVENAESNSFFNVTPISNQSFEHQRQRLSKADKRRERETIQQHSQHL